MPVVPPGSEEVVTDTPVAIVIESDAVLVFPAASVTFATKLDVPLPVGVPLITPVEDARLKPAGTEPDEMLQV